MSEDGSVLVKCKKYRNENYKGLGECRPTKEDPCPLPKCKQGMYWLSWTQYIKADKSKIEVRLKD